MSVIDHRFDDPPDPDHPDPEYEAWDPSIHPPIPDALDLVIEAEAMVTIFAAQRFVRVEAMRREALLDAQRYGYQLTDVIERSVRLELAAGLSITEAAAGDMIAQADALVNRYRAALESLEQARMTPRHAALLVSALDEVEPEFRDQLLPEAVRLAETQPVGTFRRNLRTLIETVRAVSLTERYERALPARRVVVETASDGMAWLHAFVPSVEAFAAHGRLTATAKVLAGREGESRTLDQLRADVFGDILIDGIADCLPPEARGIRATVVVTVPVLALLDPDGSGAGVATVEGIGPIPIERARELSGGAEGWMRVLTHPETGMVLSVGRDRYRPPRELQRLIRWRAERCMAPGCGVPASRCEIDHNVPWQDGGVTALWNHAPLCKGHHIVRHHGRWCVEQIEGSGGAVQWTSPTGRVYRVEPERRVPVFTIAAGDAAPF